MHARAADGTKIGYDVVGEGAPLVLLAGQSNPRVWWDLVRGDFAARYRTVAVDMVGTGESDEPVDGVYSTARFADDVIAVLDDLGIDKAHVYGTSMGGKVAQRLVIDHPDRVGAVVLGCTGPGGAGGVDAPKDAIGPLLGSQRRATLIDLMFTPGFVPEGGYRVLGGMGMSLAGLRGHKRASSQHDSWDELGGIAAPVLVVHGTDDLLSPVENGTRIAERVPGAELVLIEGARHAYFEEFRGRASGVVLDFLDRHPL